MAQMPARMPTHSVLFQRVFNSGASKAHPKRIRGACEQMCRGLRSVNKVGVGRKPGSVEGHHSSGRCVTTTLKRPTRGQCGPHHRPSIRSCSRRGLPCRLVLPLTRCALTAPFHPYRPVPATSCDPVNTCLGGLLSAALSVGSRPPGVTWRPVLWSPDFPPQRAPKHNKALIDELQR